MVWLKESHANPPSFWKALTAASDLLLPWPGKSIPLEKYNFFHDIVIRNRMSAAPAFRWHQARRGWQEASFAELGALAGATASHWAKAGVEAGRKVCLIHPMGIGFAVGLLAALKLGAVISVLPPEGRSFLKRRLEALEPDYIAIEHHHRSLIPGWLDRVIGEEKAGSRVDSALDRSHTYPAGSTVAMLFDPSAGDLPTPKELRADEGYLCPLRDGLVVLGLRPGSAFAAPGMHFSGTQPAMLLASLLTGATYVHIEPEQLAADPGLLSAKPLKTIGISACVRDLLLKNPVDMSGSCGVWLRDVAETSDLDLWQEFANSVGLRDTYGGNFRWNPSLGGCILFSIRRTGFATMKVLPSPGVGFELSGDMVGDAGSARGAGMFSPLAIGAGEGEATATSDLIVCGRGEWIYGGSLASGRRGRVYPTEEVLEAVRAIPRCGHAAMVEHQAPGGRGSVFTLLVFTGGRPPGDPAEICKAIESGLRREMGEEYLPDGIRFFPLYPRRGENGDIDGEWCRSQYLRGGLTRRSRGEVYRCLTRLRRYLDG